jgi:hypothetical protein
VVPKHRRSEIEPSLASVGAPVNTSEFWPEAVGYGSWQERQDWQDWGPPPALHPDHPSAPVPRVQFPADHPSAPVPRVRLPADHPPGPMSAPRTPGAPDLAQRGPGGSARTWSGPPQTPNAGYDNGNRRLHAVRNGAPAADHAATALPTPENLGRQFPRQPAADLAGADWREMTGFQRQPGPAPRDAAGYQRQTGPGWQETTDYRRETGPFGPGPGPATGRFQNGRSPNRDSLWTAGQVLTLADGQAAQIAQEAQDYAAAIREAAEREAAAITQQATNRADAITQQATAIREAAEREAAELRASLDSMSGQLGRVAAYVTESLAAPAMPATAPAIGPAMPATAPAMPGTAPDLPGARPALPRTRSAPPATRPARPGTRPAGPVGPRTTPTKKPQKPGRQKQAMRITTAVTAALVSIAVISGAAEIGLHGFPFFVFRETGAGETGPAGGSDQQFLAKEAAAAKAAAPKGRHHKKSHQTLEVHH